VGATLDAEPEQTVGLSLTEKGMATVRSLRAE